MSYNTTYLDEIVAVVFFVGIPLAIITIQYVMSCVRDKK